MDSRIKALVSHVAKEKCKNAVTMDAPTYQQVHDYLKSCFPGAEQFASAFFNTMSQQHWQDRNRKPLTNWRATARIYASRAHLRNL